MTTFARRDRTRVDYVYDGTWTPDIRYIPPGRSIRNGGYSRCRDNPGVPGLYESRDQGLLIEKLTCEGGYLTGDLHGNGFRIATGECPTDRYPAVNASNIVMGSPSESNTVMASKVLASTNPSKAHVNLPLSIVELRDLPNLVRNYGAELFEGGLSSAFLSYQFGMKPVISDAQNMLKFPLAVERRMKVLKRLRDRGFTVRKVQLDNQSGDPVTTFVGIDHRTTIDGRSLYGYETSSWSQKTWGYATWHLDDHKSIIGDDKLMQRALASLRGVDNILSLSNLWELLPWTWLLDYFGNVGDILASNQNTVGASHGGYACICVHSIAKMNCKPERPEFVPPYSSRFETKSRTQVPSILSANLPYLNGDQVSILASIGATRR